MAGRYKVGDRVIAPGLSQESTTWLCKTNRGTITGRYEGLFRANLVTFDGGGILCFSDDELSPASGDTPGQRMLRETTGLYLGIDATEAQRIMRKAFAGPAPETEHSAVTHPSHYTSHPSGVECIEIVKHLNFPVGNAIKYLWRAGLKGDAIQDLEKAKRYIEIEIERLKETV